MPSHLVCVHLLIAELPTLRCGHLAVSLALQELLQGRSLSHPSFLVTLTLEVDLSFCGISLDTCGAAGQHCVSDSPGWEVSRTPAWPLQTALP